MQTIYKQYWPDHPAGTLKHAVIAFLRFRYEMAVSCDGDFSLRDPNLLEATVTHIKSLGKFNKLPSDRRLSQLIDGRMLHIHLRVCGHPCRGQHVLGHRDSVKSSFDYRAMISTHQRQCQRTAA